MEMEGHFLKKKQDGVPSCAIEALNPLASGGATGGPKTGLHLELLREDSRDLLHHRRVRLPGFLPVVASGTPTED